MRRPLAPLCLRGVKCSESRIVHRAGKPFQACKIATLRSEPKLINTKAIKDLNTRRGKELCPRRGIGKRKLQHKIDSRAYQRLGTWEGSQNCRLAALYEFSAHHGDHRVSALASGAGKQMRVPRVQRIALTDHTRYFHTGLTPFPLSFFFLYHYNIPFWACQRRKSRKKTKKGLKKTAKCKKTIDKCRPRRYNY